MNGHIVTALAVTGAIVTGGVFADRAQYRAFTRIAERFGADAGVHDDTPVTEQDLRVFPEPLARLMRFSGVIGRKRISAVHAIHSGRFKPGADKPWMPVRGEYYITTRRPSFVWYGKVRMAPGLTVVAIDSYAGGRGRMLVKALSIFPLVDDQSPQVSHSAFGRCVAELMMAPTFLLDRSRVRCVQAGKNQARCTVTDAGLSTDADFFVNADGSLDRIVVMRYFSRGGGAATLERFTGKGSQYRSFDGRMLASRMDGTWNLPEGDLHYVSFDIDSVTFE